MRPLAIFAAVLPLLTLGACSTPKLPASGLPPAFVAAGPDVAKLPPQALESWWRGFDDPVLNDLIDQALKTSPDARAATARLREAQATASTGLLAFLPQGALNGQTKQTHTTQVAGKVINIPGFSSTGVSDSSGATLNVSWELDLFGRVFTVAQAAKGDSAAARFNYEAARASLAANVADSYFQVQGAAIQLADARETVRIQKDLSRVAQTKAERGLASAADADRVAGDLAQALSQADSLEAEHQAARRTLLVLVGRGGESTAALQPPTTISKIPAVPETVPGALLARRPDVREAEARVWSAVGRRNYDVLTFFPTFTLTPGVGLSKSSQTGFSSTTRNWSIGGTVTQPVLAIPRLMAELKAQNARTEQALIAYSKSVQTAFGEADNALERLSSDRRRVALLTDGERRAGQAYAASHTRYVAGLDDLQTTLGAEQSWRATRSQLTGAQVQALRRAVQTYKALGGGWTVTPRKQEAREQ